ncbi:DUF2946 family protein [Brevundimonas sp.]
MNRSRIESWSISRSLAFLAAVFAITLGTLLPFAAMAAATPGHPIVICSAEGPMTIQVGGDMDGPGGKTHPARCAACVIPLPAVLPEPPIPEPSVALRVASTVVYTPASVSPPPPARAPPRPPSTAPPTV